MSIVSSGQDGIFLSGLEVRTSVLQDSTKQVSNTATLFPGRLVSLIVDPVDATNSLIREALAADTFIYGVTDANKNVFSDDTKDRGTGVFGGGKANVYSKCLAVFRPNTYLQTDDTEQVINSYQSDISYAPGNALAVADIGAAGDGQAEGVGGLVTRLGVGAAGTVVVGVVTKAPSATELELEAYIECPAGSN